MQRKELIEAGKDKTGPKDFRDEIEVTPTTIYLKRGQLLARIFGVSEPSIYNWKRKGMPWKSAKGFNLIKCADWRKANAELAQQFTKSRTERLKDSAEMAGDETTAKLLGEAWDIRKDAADAQLAELKLQQALDRYAIRDQVERTATNTFNTLRAMLKAVGVRMKTLVPDRGDEIKSEVDEIINRCLKATEMALGECPDPEEPWALEIESTVFDQALDTLKSEVMASIPPKARSRTRVAKVLENWIDAMRIKLSDLSEKYGWQGNTP
jgi:phage terminase Nu1 subunit (DNA packaging protein)